MTPTKVHLVTAAPGRAENAITAHCVAAHGTPNRRTRDLHPGILASQRIGATVAFVLREHYRRQPTFTLDYVRGLISQKAMRSKYSRKTDLTSRLL